MKKMPDKNNIGKACIAINDSHKIRSSGLRIIGMDNSSYLVEGFIGKIYHKGMYSNVTHGTTGTKNNCWFMTPHEIKILGEYVEPKAEATLFNIDDL